MATTSSSAGHRGIVLPSGTSELQEMCNQLRAHHNGMHGQVADLAAFLKGVLPAEIARRGGRGVPGNMDGRFGARRVTKPLQEIAKLDQEIAKLWVVTYTRYSEYVLNVKQQRAAGGTFNADR